MTGDALTYFRLRCIAEQKYGTVTKKTANPRNTTTTEDY
jgi:hypothetical protein